MSLPVDHLGEKVKNLFKDENASVFSVRLVDINCDLQHVYQKNGVNLGQEVKGQTVFTNNYYYDTYTINIFAVSPGTKRMNLLRLRFFPVLVKSENPTPHRGELLLFQRKFQMNAARMRVIFLRHFRKSGSPCLCQWSVPMVNW